MNIWTTESSYPVSFRAEEATRLGDYLKQRQSVNLVGMKRVGISNFLRFFLYHKDIVNKYINEDEKHLFISVDLNDLVEREIYPFWTLTLKRVVDSVEASDLPDAVKKQIGNLFLMSIQSQDLFLVIDSIRKALLIIVAQGYYPTLFFLRFDRLQDAFNPSFFDNLEGLRDATEERLAYVFTSYRSLDFIFPQVKTSLSVFCQQMYVKPAEEEDMQIVAEAYKKRYHLELSAQLEKELFACVGGNIQYLQLALIVLKEKTQEVVDPEKLLSFLLADERIAIESEELWESLQREEQMILLEVAKGNGISADDYALASYLWEVGILSGDQESSQVFSPLFASYLASQKQEFSEKAHAEHLTRKEHLLFSLLQKHMGEICEREQIIETVWSEYEDFGVSDWAIDRLVARVRLKLREQKSQYEIVTVRTRGYKLVMA